MDKIFTIDQSDIADMSFASLVGCIFIRSQAIEQLMRQLLESSSNYTVPNDFERKTFGQLLIDLARFFPDIKTPERPECPGMTPIFKPGECTRHTQRCCPWPLPCRNGRSTNA